MDRNTDRLKQLPITKISPKLQKLLDSGELNIDDLREFAKDNVLTSTDVSKILGISKQRMTVLKNENRLIPIDDTHTGLFFSGDVEKYILDAVGIILDNPLLKNMIKNQINQDTTKE